MIFEQTLQVLSGTGVALLYGGATASLGSLVLALILGQGARPALLAQIGQSGFLWLGFVLGQGILGVVWLFCSLAGVLYNWLVWIVLAVGWLFLLGMIFKARAQIIAEFRLTWREVRTSIRNHRWYGCLAMSLALLIVLKGLVALLPSMVDDALHWYLTVGKVIGESHALQFLPFVTPHNALYPLQVEMHWAALFAVSNESAVTVWDYLCGVSFLYGVAYFSWFLTSNRRIPLLTVLIVLSTLALYDLIGGGKADNAAAQYGIAAFLWITLLPIVNLRASVLVGLCLGWAIASRYTNIILAPALLVLTLMLLNRQTSTNSIWIKIKQQRNYWVRNAAVAGAAAALVILPMLIKNWLLVGCPLAPFVGCQGSFWREAWTQIDRQNLSLLDLILYPFVWTFAKRADMLGNISPLFIGLIPLLVAYRGSPNVKSALIAGLAGVIALLTWLLIHPFILFTRWLLVPLALLAIPLSASVVAAERDLGQTTIPRLLFGSAILTLVFFLFFESRQVVYAVRYVAAIDSRAERYNSMPGFDVASWLNAHAKLGDRIALAHWRGYPYFLESHHLLNSESPLEIQELWEYQLNLTISSWTPDLWRSYVKSDFTYVIVRKNLMDPALSAWPGDIADTQLSIAFAGKDNAVLKIEPSIYSKEPKEHFAVLENVERCD